MSNQTGIGEKLKSYLKHPGSFIVMLLVMLGANYHVCGSAAF